MPINEADGYSIDSMIKLIGYTSTSKQLDKALEFATVECPPDLIPVVFEIFFKGTSGLFELDDGITAYPGEEEVLLQDGLEYKVIGNEDRENKATQQKYRLIQLKYPA